MSNYTIQYDEMINGYSLQVLFDYLNNSYSARLVNRDGMSVQIDNWCSYRDAFNSVQDLHRHFSN